MSGRSTSHDDEEIFALCDLVRQTAFDLHTWFRHGHLEKVYENSLAHRLRKQGLKVIQQHRLPVHDEDGTLVGDFVADLFVEDRLIVEIKACRALAPEHTAQLLGYLRASSIEHGLLINAGTPVIQFKKLVLRQED